MSKTPLSESLFERAKKVIPGGVHSPVRAFRGVGGTPRFIASSRGAELVDVDGNSYVDFCMAWGPLIFGHQDEEVSEAVRRALSRGWSYGAAEPYSLELAEIITGALPWVEKVRFVNSGTEAVMTALRVARAATQRPVILKFDGCYHGHVDSMLVRSGSGLAEMASPDSAGVSPQVASETLVVPLNDLGQLREAFALHGSKIAGAIIEGVAANNGLLPQPPELLKELATLCKKHGSILILDEVITGFRVAFGGVAELSGVRPDLVTYGKVIGGGFPVGAYGGRKDLMDLIAPVGAVYQAGTLSANPVAMSAGLAMLKKLKRENPFESLARKTEDVSTALELSLAASGIGSVKVQRTASLFWPILGKITSKDGWVRNPKEIPATQKETYAKLFHHLLGEGYYLAPSGFEVSFLSTAHGKSQLEGLIEAVGRFRA